MTYTPCRSPLTTWVRRWKSRNDVAPMAAPSAEGCMWMMSGPMATCTVPESLLQCGWASVRKGGDPTLRAVYDRLWPRTGKKRAIIAVTRRLVVRLRAKWLEALEEEKAIAA